jgi:hypothetical protein
MITRAGCGKLASPVREETDGKGPAKGTSPAVDFTLWEPGLRFPGPPDHL